MQSSLLRTLFTRPPQTTGMLRREYFVWSMLAKKFPVHRREFGVWMVILIQPYHAPNVCTTDVDDLAPMKDHISKNSLFLNVLYPNSGDVLGLIGALILENLSRELRNL